MLSCLCHILAMIDDTFDEMAGIKPNLNLTINPKP
jgi:hypothetical protein